MNRTQFSSKTDFTWGTADTRDARLNGGSVWFVLGEGGMVEVDGVKVSRKLEDATKICLRNTFSQEILDGAPRPRKIWSRPTVSSDKTTIAPLAPRPTKADPANRLTACWSWFSGCDGRVWTLHSAVVPELSRGFASQSASPILQTATGQSLGQLDSG